MVNHTLRRLNAAVWAVLLLAGCSLVSYVDYRIDRDYPTVQDQELPLAGLDAPVEVYLDAAGIPHIHAQSEKDLLFAVGYLHGRDRLFEMDILRRMARGRIAELLGEQEVQGSTTVKLDATMRGWGFEDAARRTVARLDPAFAPLMDAYVAGVNRAMADYRPVEYRLLRVDPEPWTAADSLSVGLLTAWGITHNWKQETFRLLLALHGGLERAERIYPPEPWPGPATLPGADAPAPLPPSVVPEARRHLAALPPLSVGEAQEAQALPLWPVEAASDGWVVGGDHTRSGKPLLANDPHLTHLVPSIFYQQHLHAGTLDVIGTTVPGLPYVLVGHNGRVAWGLTSAVADAADLYFERLHAGDAQRVDGPDGPEPLVTRNLLVRARDGKDFVEHRFAVRRTPRGPLLNDLYPGLLPDGAPLVSVRWDLEGAADGLLGYRQVNGADDVAGVLAALRRIRVPVNVVLVADTQGQVALGTTGRVPVRRAHRGTFPVPAWEPAYRWDAWLEPDRMPRAVAGPEGRFVHANNLMYAPGHDPTLFQVDSAPAWRLGRATELVTDAADYTADEALAHQLDVRLERGEALLPLLLEALFAGTDWSPLETRALMHLRAWNLEAAADSVGATLFFTTYREAALAALEDELSPTARDFVLRLPYPYCAFDRWFLEADNPAWDDRATPVVERRDERLRQGFRQAVAALDKRWGDDVAQWRWGRLHTRHFRHLFGARRPLRKFVNMAAGEAEGGWDSLRKSHFDFGNPEHPFRSVAGAVLRMAVDLGNPDGGRWIIETGASGWPGSPHYRDQYPLWRDGGTLPMHFAWSTVKANAAALVRLVPEAAR